MNIEDILKQGFTINDLQTCRITEQQLAQIHTIIEDAMRNYSDKLHWDADSWVDLNRPMSI